MAKGRSRFSPIGIIGDHYRTFKTFDPTNKPKQERLRISDILTAILLPAAVATLAARSDARASNLGDVLTAAAILTGLVFSVFSLPWNSTVDTIRDSREDESGKIKRRLSRELMYNVHYAALIGLIFSALVGGVLMFSDPEEPVGHICSAVIVFLGCHLLLSIGIVLKRIRSLFAAEEESDKTEVPPGSS